MAPKQRTALPTSKTRPGQSRAQVLQAQHQNRIASMRAKIGKQFGTSKQKILPRSAPSAQVTRDLLDLLKQKHNIETEMAQTVKNLSKAYGSIFRDLNVVLEERLVANEALQGR